MLVLGMGVESDVKPLLGLKRFLLAIWTDRESFGVTMKAKRKRLLFPFFLQLRQVLLSKSRNECLHIFEQFNLQPMMDVFLASNGATGCLAYSAGTYILFESLTCTHTYAKRRIKAFQLRFAHRRQGGKSEIRM